MIQKILNNWRFIAAISFFIVLFLFLNQCSKTKELKSEIEANQKKNIQNTAALTDSIKIYKTNSGKNAYSKPIAEMTPDEISKFFPDLYKRLKDELGDVKILWNTHIEYVDTGSVKNGIIKLDSNKYSLDYVYNSKDSCLRFKSTNIFYIEARLADKTSNKYNINATPGISTISDLKFNLGITTGIKEENGLYKIFITPDNKNVYISDLKGADVSNMFIKQNPSETNEKPKKWSLGPYIGVGANFNKTNYMLGVGVGISLQYSLIKF